MTPVVVLWEWLTSMTVEISRTYSPDTAFVSVNHNYASSQCFIATKVQCHSPDVGCLYDGAVRLASYFEQHSPDFWS